MPRPLSVVTSRGGSDRLEAAARTPRPLDALWMQVQAHVAQQVPAAEFATWLQETHLVTLDDDRAVIGVPNIFACEQVQAVYAQQLAEVLVGQTGKRVAVEVVIDCSG